MKTFLLILLFGKAVLLTPGPIELHGRLELVPEEPLEAVTSGAHIIIDVSSMILKKEGEGILDFRERISKRFPPDAIAATLVSKDGKELSLSRQSDAYNRNETILTLNTEHGGVPTDVEYSKVIVESRVPLSGIKIIWKNYRH